jgi:basic membrane protein A and related proteins
VIIPETIRLNNAFTLGVRHANPTATVVVDWIGAWYDTTKEPLSVERLIRDFDCDIIFGHTDTQIPMGRVVELQDGDTSNGELVDFNPDIDRVYTLGYDNYDACDFSGDFCITSAYWNWGPMITRVISDIIAGDWIPSDEIYEQMSESADDSVVFYSELNSAIVLPATVTEIEGLVPRLASADRADQYFFWTGPLNDAEGTECLAAGEIPTDEALLSMCWYTEGLIDTDDAPNVAPAGVCPGEYDCTNQ